MKYTLAILFFLFSFGIVKSQMIETEFGKNRVQHHKFEWKRYESEHFITYWYGGNRNIGQSAVLIAEHDYQEIRNLLEYRPSRKLEILVFSDITDMKQTNIGNEEAFTNVGGNTKMVGNKLLVYFDGNHNNFRRDLRKGIASVLLQQMMLGNSIQEKVQNAVFLSLPEWYSRGLVEYVGEYWNTDKDHQLRQAFQENEVEDFEQFAYERPILAGHSMWYYVSRHYGQSTISNILYLTRINRDVESAYLYVLGINYYQLTTSWRSYFGNRYKRDLFAKQNLPDSSFLKIKKKRDAKTYNYRWSPDGKRLVYVTNEIGRFKVKVRDIETGKTRTVFKKNARNPIQATDYDYPLVEWSPNNQDLIVIWERRDVVYLSTVNATTKDVNTQPFETRIERVHSMGVVNQNQLVLSIIINGQSDLYFYNISGRNGKIITNDYHDDIDPKYVDLNGRRGLIFASNRNQAYFEPQRLDSILPIQTFDLYYMDLDTNTQELVRITNTPLANESSTHQIDERYFTFLSDDSGINNRQSAFLETYLDHIETLYYLKDGSTIQIHADSIPAVDSIQIDSSQQIPIYKQRAIIHNSTNFGVHIQEMTVHPMSQQIAYFSEGLEDPKVWIAPLNIDTARSVLRTSLRQWQIQNDQLEKRKAALAAKKQKEKVRKKPITPKVEPKIEDEAIVPKKKEKEKKKEKAGFLFITEFSEDEEEKGITQDSVIVPADSLVNMRDSSGRSPASYVFQSEFTDEEPLAAVIVQSPDGSITLQSPDAEKNPTQQQLHQFRRSGITPAHLKFRTYSFSSQVDNSYLMGRLSFENQHDASSLGFNTPPVGLLLKGEVRDLMEDYALIGGFRFPFTFNGMEYFVTFQDKKKRLDKYYSFYRSAFRYNELDDFNAQQQVWRRITNVGQAEFRYPLDIFQSFRGTAFIRNDKTIDLATDDVSLNTTPNNQQRIGLKAEYVYDNSYDVMLNIKNGTRAKFGFEALKKFSLQVNDEFQFEFDEGWTTVAYVDARHYQRLSKHTVWANRFAGAASFGNERILYYLGGVENWIALNKFDETTPLPNLEEGNFAFTSQAANMRGFGINIRNGSSFAVLNSELRVPLFQILSKRPIRNNFLRTFQVVGFFDMGSAWYGANPFNDESPINTIYVEGQQGVKIKVNYFRDPIVMGYGAGVRAMLLGYFVRLDYSRGIDSGDLIEKPKWFLSIGTDF